jgi:hypothetical protein
MLRMLFGERFGSFLAHGLQFPRGDRAAKSKQVLKQRRIARADLTGKASDMAVGERHVLRCPGPAGEVFQNRDAVEVILRSDPARRDFGKQGARG